MEDWKEYKLEEIVEINPTESLKKGTIAKKIGMDILQPFNRAIPSYTLEAFSGGTKFKNGDTIMARITPCLENGKTSIVNILDEGEIGFGSTEYIVFRAKEKITDPYFIYYLVTSSVIREPAIKSMVGSSGRQRVQTDVVANLTINLPPLPTQQKIAQILSSLDDKIELNNKINANLEQQAQALFKSWFVDFEPFGGEMPAGWKVGKLSDVIETNTEEVFCIRGADIPEVKIGNKGKMPTRYILPKNWNQKKLTDGDLVVEISGGSPTQSTGRVAYISNALLDRYNNKIICTNFCKAVKPQKNLSMYVYYLWQHLYNKDVFFNYENGTTGVKNLDMNGILMNEDIVIPSEDYLKKFNEFCSLVFKEIFANGNETEKLSNLRDTLLPKLMNGELDVDKIEL